MKFCPECGKNIEGSKFCADCGFKVPEETGSTQAVKHEQLNSEKTLLTFATHLFGFEDAKKSVGGKFDLKIPRVEYTLTNQRILLQHQKLTVKREEIELTDVESVDVKQGLKEKVMKIGHIILNFKNGETKTFKQLQEPYKIKDAIRSAVNNRKAQEKVEYRVDL